MEVVTPTPWDRSGKFEMKARCFEDYRYQFFSV